MKPKAPHPVASAEEPPESNRTAEANLMLSKVPIIHIDALAKALGLNRRWILDNWVGCDQPVPHFRDGKQVFFNIDAMNEWSRRRSEGNED